MLAYSANWPTIALAGGLFLLGVFALEAAGFDGGLLKVGLVFVAAFAANAVRPLRQSA